MHTANKDEKMEGMPIGYDNFRELRDSDFYFVDKTPLIDMVLKSSSKVMLFTRPRRFGKSLNLSMLDSYLNLKYAGERDRFSDLKISEIRPDDPEKNSNVVIEIDLKSVVTSDYDKLIDTFRTLMMRVYDSFNELESSDKLTSAQKRIYASVVEMTSSYGILVESLLHLCMMLTKHYGKAPIVLIDEYDHPMNDSYGNYETHDRVRELLGTFLGNGLKGNDFLRFAVMTGVMRISKESIFSGLNNPKVFDVLSIGFDEMYGFTQSEVEKLLIDNGYGDKIEEAREWYDGYRFGDADIYNPWSILNYIDEGCKPYPYWAGTSGNSILGDLLSRVDCDTWDNLKVLCSGDSVPTSIKSEIAYCDLQDPGRSIYSVMVASGYLKALPQGAGYIVSLPNKEMFSTLAETILDRYGTSVNMDVSNLIDAMACGDTVNMAEILKNQFELLSNRILTHEHVYQGFLTGLMAIVHGRYEVTAEREIRKGYYDIRLKRVSGAGPNVVLEIKRRNKKNVDMTMDELAQEGLRQIHEKGYADGLTGKTMIYGVAFDGKDPAIAMEKL